MKIKDIPFRIPDTWSAAWYRDHFVQVVAQADYQNGSFLSLADVSEVVRDHNADPFSHPDLINAHKAEANPHPRYELPVGSIFFTADNINPGVLLGYGTWVLRAEGLNLAGGTPVVTPTDDFLLESGDHLLLESGDLLLLE